MALINVTNVEILDNPTKFTNQFQFEITFECLPPGVQEELEWKLVYVGSAEDEKYDQELDSVLVGPVVVGKNKFVFSAPPPDPKLIPEKDLLEVTVLLLTASYREKEFIRIGYYVNNDYRQDEGASLDERKLGAERAAWVARVTQMQVEYANAVQQAQEAAAGGGDADSDEGAAAPPLPPAPAFPQPPKVNVALLSRNILADKPRVTRFNVPWDVPQGGQEFAMDAADEAKASELAQSPDGGAASASGAAGAGGDACEDEEESADEDDEMEDGEEGEEGEEEEGAEDEEADMGAPMGVETTGR